MSYFRIAHENLELKGDTHPLCKIPMGPGENTEFCPGSINMIKLLPPKNVLQFLLIFAHN